MSSRKTNPRYYENYWRDNSTVPQDYHRAQTLFRFFLLILVALTVGYLIYGSLEFVSSTMTTVQGSLSGGQS